MPNWDLDKLNFWSQLAMAMTGLELSPILSGEVRNPRRAIVRATWISAVLVVLFYIFSHQLDSDSSETGPGQPRDRPRAGRPAGFEPARLALGAA